MHEIRVTLLTGTSRPNRDGGPRSHQEMARVMRRAG
jgi:hypothetical protein